MNSKQKKYGVRKYEENSSWFTGILNAIPGAMTKKEAENIVESLGNNVKTEQFGVVFVGPKYYSLFVYLLIVLASLFLVVGFLVATNCGSKWFSMFASLTVLFGVAAKYRLYKYEMLCLYGELETRSDRWSDTGYGDLSREKWHDWASRCSHVLVIVGTLIWGFGELIPFHSSGTCA